MTLKLRYAAKLMKARPIMVNTVMTFFMTDNRELGFGIFVPLVYCRILIHQGGVVYGIDSCLIAGISIWSMGMEDSGVMVRLGKC